MLSVARLQPCSGTVLSDYTLRDLATNRLLDTLDEGTSGGPGYLVNLVAGVAVYHCESYIGCFADTTGLFSLLAVVSLFLLCVPYIYPPCIRGNNRTSLNLQSLSRQSRNSPFSTTNMVQCILVDFRQVVRSVTIIAE